MLILSLSLVVHMLLCYVCIQEEVHAFPVSCVDEPKTTVSLEQEQCKDSQLLEMFRFLVEGIQREDPV